MRVNVSGCVWVAFVCCCFACDCVLELVVCRVRFARVSCPWLRFGRLGRHHLHTWSRTRRPIGHIRDGEITHLTQVTPIVVDVQIVPGARAQVNDTIMETSALEAALTEPQKTLTRNEQGAADAAAHATRGEEWTAEDLSGALRNLFNQLDISGASFRVMKIAPHPLFPNMAHLQPLPTSANPPPGEPTRQKEEASQNTPQVDGGDDHRVPAAAEAAAEDAAATEADARRALRRMRRRQRQRRKRQRRKQRRPRRRRRRRRRWQRRQRRQ